MNAAFLLAFVLFALNFALGVSLQLGVRWRARIVHHVLYFGVCASLGVSLLLALLAGASWWAQGTLLVAMLLMPSTHPGRADHALLACAVGVGFTLTAWRLV